MTIFQCHNIKQRMIGVSLDPTVFNNFLLNTKRIAVIVNLDIISIILNHKMFSADKLQTNLYKS